MKALFSLIILLVCLFTFLPMIVLIFEHAFSYNGDSILSKLLDNLSEDGLL